MDYNSGKPNTLILPDDYSKFAEKILPKFERLETIGTYSSIWTIENFSNINTKLVEGPTFKTDQHSWRLFVYPKGNKDYKENHTSLFLENVESKNKISTEDVCAIVALCIIDPQDPTRVHYKVTHHRFTQYEADWGFSNFISWDELYGDEGNDEKPYIFNDEVMFMPIVQLKKDPTGVLWHNFALYDSKEMTGHVGLYNQGATCYMNSLFQSLFFTNIYRKSVYQIPTEKDDPRNSVALALQRLFYNLQFSGSAVSTTELTESFGWNSYDSFMQHDVQEFNRLLQEHIERKMVNTPAEGTIKEIFVGKTKSYIKCINVDYESSRSEEFYDIQLNVKGCQDLKESFEDYVQEEILEKENKYMAGGHGLQDAKKGVIFESFPPVLQIQLKRFEYDMTKDTMIKINDRHEFPSEIDLQPYHTSRDHQEDQSQSYKYILHGVLVHSGNLTGGHYFAFVRPSKENKWFEFNDDRVTPVTIDQVLEDNYGGQSKYSNPETSNMTIRETNAYMLVYIRETYQEKVLKQVTKQDIPTHLIQRITNEKEISAAIEKQRSEQHLYMTVYTVTDSGFMMNRDTGFVSYNEDMHSYTESPVQQQQVLRAKTVGEFLMEYASNNDMDINNVKIWLFEKQQNFNAALRPSKLIPVESYNKTLQDYCCTGMNAYPMLRFYIDYWSIQKPPIIKPGQVLIFAKYFDPVTQTLCGAGKVYVSVDSMVYTIQETLNAMVELKKGTKLDIYQELGNGDLLHLHDTWPFYDYDIMNGDIICFQKSQTSQQYESHLFMNKCPDLKSYYDFLDHRIDIHFQQRDDIYKEQPSTITLTLRTDMSIQAILENLAHHVNSAPECIHLLYPNQLRKKPLLISLAPYSHEYKLMDILELCPQFDLDNEYYDFKKAEWILYYDVLPISLTGSKHDRLVRIHVCYTLNQPQTQVVLLPKRARIMDLCDAIEPNRKVRIFRIDPRKRSSVEVFSLNQTVGKCIQNDEEDLYAEITPKEEYYIVQEDFYITVFHYEENLTQTHSIPFRFLIFKNETFTQTKKRLQERAGLNNEQWSKVKFTVIHNYNIIKGPEGEASKTSDSIKNKSYSLAIGYPDPQGRYSLMANNSYDKGLYIKN